MRRIALLTVLILGMTGAFAQQGHGKEGCSTGDFLDGRSLGWVDHVGDFTITDTDGVEHNLYETLDAGNTVMLDLFQAT